jgi:hypothetical protein
MDNGFLGVAGTMTALAFIAAGWLASLLYAVDNERKERQLEELRRDIDRWRSAYIRITKSDPDTRSMPAVPDEEYDPEETTEEEEARYDD